MEKIASSASILVGAVLGVIASHIHVDRGGLERSTWSSGMELAYTFIGMLVILRVLFKPKSETTALFVLLVAAAITTYHMFVGVKKARASHLRF